MSEKDKVTFIARLLGVEAHLMACRSSLLLNEHRDARHSLVQARLELASLQIVDEAVVDLSAVGPDEPRATEEPLKVDAVDPSDGAPESSPMREKGL